MKINYIESVCKQLEYYKMLGEKTIEQLPADKLFWHYNHESNSIAIIVHHLCGNMLSRWTDFFTTDGEKAWRDRDLEFEDILKTKAELLHKWKEGWECLFNAIRPLGEEDLGKVIYIRNQGHTVLEAINRQLAHYSYHVGQIVFIGKMVAAKEWTSLSIPKGKSKTYNQDTFSKEKNREHFTDSFLRDDIITKLKHAHHDFWQFAGALPNEQANALIPAKWSVAQQVEHINKVLFQVNKFLSMPKEKLAEKFGLSTRKSFSKEELIATYQQTLAQGGKAPAIVVPDSRTNFKVQELTKEGNALLIEFDRQVEHWNLSDMDKYNFPHPLLGAINLREMLYLLEIHTQRHHQSCMQMIGSK
jgi:hypothetical protein